MSPHENICTIALINIHYLYINQHALLEIHKRSPWQTSFSWIYRSSLSFASRVTSALKTLPTMVPKMPRTPVPATPLPKLVANPPRGRPSPGLSVLGPAFHKINWKFKLKCSHHYCFAGGEPLDQKHYLPVFKKDIRKVVFVFLQKNQLTCLLVLSLKITICMCKHTFGRFFLW